jgi:hypothetical protein
MVRALLASDIPLRRPSGDTGVEPTVLRMAASLSEIGV